MLQNFCAKQQRTLKTLIDHRVAEKEQHLKCDVCKTSYRCSARDSIVVINVVMTTGTIMVISSSV